MNKKLMAVAVAGALVAPAAAMAQSNVQVFGNIYMEYSFINQGSATNGTDGANADVLQTPGSEIGFKGEEKLGGGMSAWFQCSSTADYRGNAGDGFCTRNSAVGLKGGFGNVYIGIWDTPYKRTQINTGGRDTGVFGTAFLLSGNSTTVSDGASTGVFKRRQRNLITYDSPSFGGFQVSAAFSSTNSSTATPGANAGAKPRIWSLGASYKIGGLDLGAGYEQHDKMIGANTAGPVGDADGWHAGASYAFGNVKVGGMYTQQEADAGGASQEVKAWHLGVEWKIAGPHNLHAGYTQADDAEGTAGTNFAGGGIRPAVGTSTGAKLWQIRYLHDFSKRTTGTVGYVALKNDSNANYNLGGITGVAGNGSKDRAFAVSLQHRF